MHVRTIHHNVIEIKQKKCISSNQNFIELKGAFTSTDLLILVGFTSFSLKIHSSAFTHRASLTQILKYVHDALKKALRIHVTERLFLEAQHGHNINDFSSSVFWKTTTIQKAGQKL